MTAACFGDTALCCTVLHRHQATQLRVLAVQAAAWQECTCRLLEFNQKASAVAYLPPSSSWLGQNTPMAPRFCCCCCCSWGGCFVLLLLLLFEA